MSTPAGWAADLHYSDEERVQLDLDAIIARGGRLRRRRQFVRLAAVAAVCATVPAAIFFGRSDPLPGLRSVAGASAPAAAPNHGIFSAQRAPAVSSPMFGKADLRLAGGISSLEFTPLEAGLQVKAHLPVRFGRLLAIAGARARSGVWLAAAASRLTLIHLSANGALKSWQLPTTSSRISAGTNLGFAVSAGVAWLGLNSTLIRVDTRARPAQISSWRLPGPRASQANTAMVPAMFGTIDSGAVPQSAATGTPRASYSYSLAVSPGGRVAVARLRSSSVQLFDPHVGTFSQIRLPALADQSLALGFALDGTLGIGYQALSHKAAVLLVERSGAELTTTVAQSSAISAYGRSALLVGSSRLDVVSWRGKVRPLVLPARRQVPYGGSAPPAPLPEGRFGIVSDAGILTFPAAADSVAEATDASLFWSIPRPGCAMSHCPPGYELLTTDAAGNVWLVPTADQRIIELLSVR